MNRTGYVLVVFGLCAVFLFGLAFACDAQPPQAPPTRAEFDGLAGDLADLKSRVSALEKKSCPCGPDCPCPDGVCPNCPAKAKAIENQGLWPAPIEGVIDSVKFIDRQFGGGAAVSFIDGWAAWPLVWDEGEVAWEIDGKQADDGAVKAYLESAKSGAVRASFWARKNTYGVTGRGKFETIATAPVKEAKGGHWNCGPGGCQFIPDRPATAAPASPMPAGDGWRYDSARSEWYRPVAAPTHSAPTHAPVYSAPVAAPVYSAPTHAPVYSAPVAAPVYSAPVYRRSAPVYSAPVYRRSAPAFGGFSGGGCANGRCGVRR